MPKTITCFGEVLWDIFPTHKKIGGAPLNVASRLASFNNSVNVISRIGNDTEGEGILNFLKEAKVNTNYIQIDEKLSTGVVSVSLDEKGSATYTIEFPSAWDFIQANNGLISLVNNSDALIFGSLVARHDISRNALFELLNSETYKVFDVNLRPPHYSQELLFELMNKADFIKFNDDELLEICHHLGSKEASIEDNMRFISEATNTPDICVTKGAHGASLMYNNTVYNNKGFSVKVVDTVGAGDSFLATLIHNLLEKNTPKSALNVACAVGAMVAGREGANPKITEEEINSFIDS